MAARPIWRGYLKVSLVNVPIRVFPATDSAATLSFNQLHASCQTRIQQKRWCPRCDTEVPAADIVKGYEFEKGRWVVLTEDDFAKVRTPSTKVINLVQFVDQSALNPVYFERPYYLAPDGDAAAESFAVMREGMTGKVGIGKLALNGREYLVAVQPFQKGLMLYTLRHAGEIRSLDTVTELERLPARLNPEEVKLARHVIGSFESDAEFSTYTDEYQQELRRIIDAKIAGEEVVAREVDTPTNVVSLMDALRKSLDSISAAKKRPARSGLVTPMAPRRAANGARRRAR